MSRIRTPILIAIPFLSLVVSTAASAADITASSCTQSDVQAAINAATDGSTVSIPVGRTRIFT
jgi:hypothetical protein